MCVRACVHARTKLPYKKTLLYISINVRPSDSWEKPVQNPGAHHPIRFPTAHAVVSQTDLYSPTDHNQLLEIDRPTPTAIYQDTTAVAPHIPMSAGTILNMGWFHSG